jgi:Holliday junction DNA helicase RuvA
MIASIEGRLAAIDKRAVVVQVGGVGFRVHVPDSFIAHCGPVGSAVSLYTHLHVREDELALYGCATESELRLFELLLSVSGVGPRVALSLLSVLSDDELRLAIAGEQADVLTRVPGIGAKTAKKIILDLKDKVEATLGLARPEILDEDTEVIAALTGLGYSIVEAQTALQHVPVSTRGVQDRLRAALIYLGS